MSDSRGKKIKLQQALKCCVILSVLLPSMSAFAETTGAPVSDTMQAVRANHAAATARFVSAKRSGTQSKSTFRKASEIDLSDTKKVTKDDFGRVLSTVRQPMNTRMIWLGQQSRTYRPPMPKTTWLGGKGPSD